MRFIDEAKIAVKAGDGGNGCCSFRREAHEPHGGPDGGDGGRGGSVIFQADPGLATLADYRYKRRLVAERGEHGRGKQQYGRSGADLIVRVPVGTLVKDEQGGLLADLCEQGQAYVAAQGGRGGRGNMHFATPTNRAPRRKEPGEEGEERTLVLELKLLADVGLIGKPNAGKSTLLSKITRAHPKIADYPFTTLVPQLGVAKPFEDHPGFTVADIPGLVEGAHAGVGLGLEFLRHIERTKLFLHLIDAANPLEDPLEAYQQIRQELLRYNPDFESRPEWIVLTKIDLDLGQDSRKKLQNFFKKKRKKVFFISSIAGTGIQELVNELATSLRRPDPS